MEMNDIAKLLQEVERLKLENGSLKSKLTDVETKLSEVETKLSDVESRSVFRYFQDGQSLPEIYQDGTNTGPTPNRKHEPVNDYIECEFGLIPIAETLLENGKTRTTKMFEETVLKYSTEKDIEDYCKIVIEDMINIGNLSSSLSLRSDLAIAELKADFWVISYNGYPIGAREIKKPETLKKRQNMTKDQETKKLIYGQLFDYLMRIRSFHGVRFVFGIFSDFKEWRVCWLPDSELLAQSTILDFLPESSIDQNTAENRRLHVSCAYLYNDTKSLANALYSVLYKMNLSANLVDPVPLLSPTRSYIVMNQQTWQWKSGIKTKQLLFKMPPKQTKEFYLLRDFHGGADGKVWLACSEKTGALVVIKFQCKIREGRIGNEQENVEREVSYWKKVGFSDVYHTKLADRHAVIMPFGFHYKRSATNELVIDDTWWMGEVSKSLPIKDFNLAYGKVKEVKATDALEKCIETFSLAKLVHEDIKWHHVAVFPRYVGWIQDKLVMKPSFIDLTRIKEETSKKQAEDVMKEVMNNLLVE